MGNSHQLEGFFSHQWDEIKFSPVGKKFIPLVRKKYFPLVRIKKKKILTSGNKMEEMEEGEEWVGRGRKGQD